MSRTIKSFVCGLIVSTTLCAGAMIANALSTSKSAMHYSSANSIRYESYNSVTTGENAYGSKYASAYTSISATNASSLQGGACGVYPRLYNGKGTLVAYNNDWSYSSSNSSGIGSTAMAFDVDTSVSYFSNGKIRMWTNNGYAETIIYQSPNLSDFT